MDLWILNQEKNGLYKVDNISVDSITKAVITKLGNDHEWLGYYQTEERALEVLGEIQKLLIGDVLASKNFNTPNDECLKSVGINNAAVYYSFTDDSQQVKFLHRDCVIYKMPER